MKTIVRSITLLLPTLIAASISAQAATFDVLAKENSSEFGIPVPTLSLSAGDAFSVTVDPTDLWSAGFLPRWSNADGLTKVLYATGSDDSHQPVGTLIGLDWGLWTLNGFTAPFGALVGRIGTDYMLLGTSYSGVAPSTGTLELMFWDGEAASNSDKITATVTLVPEPSCAALGLLASLVAFWKSRRSA